MGLDREQLEGIGHGLRDALVELHHLAFADLIELAAAAARGSFGGWRGGRGWSVGCRGSLRQRGWTGRRRGDFQPLAHHAASCLWAVRRSATAWTMASARSCTFGNG